jgi:predicted Zn-dependent protease
VWVIEDESANAWVLVHELGHVLGLGHSTEAWSVMNKAKRWQMITGRLEFTARERPVMRRTLAALLAAGRLVRGR